MHKCIKDYVNIKDPPGKEDYHPVRTLMVKKQANLANYCYNNSPSFFSLIFIIPQHCHLSINARKLSWFDVTYTSTMAPSGGGLLFMAIISPYGVAIATSLAVLPLYHWIPLYNELMITSRPNVIVIPLFHDSLIISQLHISSSYTRKIKNSNR